MQLDADGNPDTAFLAKHEALLAHRKEPIEILFLGDSITEGWKGKARTTWDQYYGRLNAANFGIAKDRTQNVLWRIEHGELEGITPKVVVLLIGTNNALSGDAPAAIARGIIAIVRAIQIKLPETKVLLLGIFPFGWKSDAPGRATLNAVNEITAKLDDGGKTVRYLDLGSRFTRLDGTISKSIMSDSVHLSPGGYKIWAESMQSTLEELLK